MKETFLFDCNRCGLPSPFSTFLNNYIDFEDGVTALDLFAGTGSISIELVSRGCDKVISVEKDPQHFAFINKVMKEVKTEKCFVLRADVFKYMERCNDKFDFIFADPPYAKEELFHEVLRIVCGRRLLTEDGLLIVEKPVTLKLDAEDRYEVLKDKTYGTTGLVFLSVNQLTILFLTKAI